MEELKTKSQMIMRIAELSEDLTRLQTEHMRLIEQNHSLQQELNEYKKERGI